MIRTSSKKLMSAFLTVLIIFVIAVGLSLAIGANAAASDTDGRWFENADELSLDKDFTDMPRTYEATVYLPSNPTVPSEFITKVYNGVILGNNTNEGYAMSFEIDNNEKPFLYYKLPDGTVMNTKFDCTVPQDQLVHLVITHEKNGVGSTFKCYINGSLAASFNKDQAFELDMSLMQLKTTLMLARDGRWRNEYYFKGKLQNVALYSEALSAEDVLLSYQNGVNKNHADIMSYYDLTKSQNHGTSVADETGNGHSFSQIFYSRPEALNPDSYDYAFAVVGDTQCLVEHDNEYSTAYTNAIYDWLVKNKDSKKIKYVMGVGDVTQDDIDAEWAVAKEQILKLNGANIPYSLVNGNHDSVAQLDKYFGSDANFTSQNIGFYSGNSLGNYYVKFTAGNTKYMILALQWAPSRAVLEWADGIVSSNAQYQVIITTHGYMNLNGELLTRGDAGTPSHYNKNNADGNDMWELLVKKNRNIKMIFSGHIASDNVIYRSDTGDEGNEVFEFLVNPQGMDHTYTYETGMIGMLYFSNGGKDVRFEYVAAYDSLKAQSTDADAEDVLFNTRNQFTFSLDKTPVASKGEIDVWLIGGQSNAVGYANDYQNYKNDDPRFTQGFENVLYYGYGEKWIYNFTPTRHGFGQGYKKSGIEIGIAEALSGSGKMNAIVKYAQGATYLAPNTASSYSKSYGTWTSPTYISENSVSTEGNKTGLLYLNFINTVESAVAELRAMGYTPVIKGMWWMQGCAESYDSFSEDYEELLTTLINDVRADVGAIVDEDLSKMPFVFGKIVMNPDYDATVMTTQNYKNVINAQAAVAAKAGFNAYLVDAKTDFADFAQVDTWHYDAKTQAYLGRRFVKEVNNLNGQSLVTSSGTNYTVTGGGLYKNGDSITVSFAAKEGYTLGDITMSVGSAAAVPVTLTSGRYSFVSDGSDVHFAVTTSGGMAQVTDYGTVPAEYTAEDYPFAIFENGAFVGASTNYATAIKAAYDILYGASGAGKSVTVLLRRDYTTTYLDATAGYITHMNGTLTVDLGENTLTRADGYLFDIYAQSTEGVLIPTALKLINGEIELASIYPLIGLNHAASSLVSGSLKHFDIDIEDVRFFIRASVKSGSGLISACWEAGANGMTTDLTFTDCVFDLTNMFYGDILISTAGASKTLTKVDTLIIGGEVIAPKVPVTFIKTDAGDSLFFGKSQGVHLVLKAGEGADITAFSGTYLSLDAKELKYEKTGTDGAYDVYTFTESAITDITETVYGTIPATYASALTYPVAVFKSDKTFVGAYGELGAALNSAISSYPAGNLIVLVRADTVKSANTAAYSFTGNLTIDLGNYTVSVNERGNYLFDFYANGVAANLGTVARGSFTIKNGTLKKIGGRGFLCVNYGSNLLSDVSVTFNFENITFQSTNSANNTSVITHSWENDGTGNVNSGNSKVNAGINITGCTFDFKNSIAGAVMLPLTYNSKDRVVFNVTVCGGKIVSDKALTETSLFVADGNTNGRADSFTFAKNTDNSYTVLELTEGTAPLTALFNGNTLVFEKARTEGGIDYYTLVAPPEPPKPEQTDYADIPTEYLSADAYPFAIFAYNAQDKTYTFKTAVASWKDALAQANTYAPATVLMRRNYTIASTDGTSVGIRAYSGEVTVDLGGKTILRSAGGQYLFDIYTNGSTTAGTISYTLKNGNIEVERWLIAFSGYSSCAVDKTINFTFDNVSFKLSEKYVSTGGGWIFSIWTDASTPKVLTTKTVFNSCTFDDTDRASAISTVPMLSYNSSVIRVSADVEINGGRYITNAPSRDLIYTKTEYSSDYPIDVTFGRDADGALMCLEQPVSATAPDFTVNGGKLVFVKVSEGISAIYRLTPKAAAELDFTPKSSITLDSDLVLNIYIPKRDYITALALCDSPLNISELTERDGYYVISLDMNARAAGGEYKLDVDLNVEGELLYPTYTFSIPRYAQKVLEDENSTDTEKTLVCDILAYIKSAYIYFDEANKAAVAEEIDTILAGYTSTFARVDGTASNMTVPEGATLILKSTPTMRFYFVESTDLTKYSFKIDGQTLAAETGSETVNSTVMKYVDISLYAYKMIKTVELYEGENKIGSFHINAYCDFAVSEGDTALVDVVEKFYTYCKSALAYKKAQE